MLAGDQTKKLANSWFKLMFLVESVLASSSGGMSSLPSAELLLPMLMQPCDYCCRDCTSPQALKQLKHKLSSTACRAAHLLAGCAASLKTAASHTVSLSTSTIIANSSMLCLLFKLIESIKS